MSTSTMAEDVFRTIDAARIEGRLENLQQRKKEIQFIHSGIKSSTRQLSEALQKDGHRAHDGLLEIYFVLETLRQLSKHLDSDASLREERLVQQHGEHVKRRRPRGSFLILGGPSLPLAQAIVPLAYAIGGGNTAVLLLSAECSATSSALLNCLEVTRLDAESVKLVSSFPNCATADYAALPFAGIVAQDSHSLEVVRKFAACDTHVIVGVPRPCPAIITRHADVEKAAKEVARAKFLLHGSSPAAPSMLFVDEIVLSQFLSTLQDVTGRYLERRGTDTHSTSGNDPTIRTEFEKAGGQVVDLNGATLLVGNVDWRDTKQIPNDVVLDADGSQSPPLVLPIFPVTSMDAAMALHAQFTSTTTLTERAVQAPPAAYLFGNPSEVRYLSLFVHAGSFSINHIPPSNSFAPLPILPVGLALDLYTEACPVTSTVAATTRLPEHIWSLPRDKLLQSIQALVQADELDPPTQKPGKNLPFFPQGALIGTSHVLAILGVGAFCLWYRIR